MNKLIQKEVLAGLKKEDLNTGLWKAMINVEKLSMEDRERLVDGYLELRTGAELSWRIWRMGKIFIVILSHFPTKLLISKPNFPKPKIPINLLFSFWFSIYPNFSISLQIPFFHPTRNPKVGLHMFDMDRNRNGEKWF